MDAHDEDLGFPGNRELVERQLAKATTQMLFLAPDAPARGTGASGGARSLAERGADAVRGVELLPAEERFHTPPPVVVAASMDGVPPDIAEAYMRAKNEVKSILAEAFPT
jgi:hypothetical protein